MVEGKHKHQLKLLRLPGLTYRFKCVTCERRFVYLREAIRDMIKNNKRYAQSYFMGAW